MEKNKEKINKEKIKKKKTKIHNQAQATPSTCPVGPLAL
ncbi:hypothetical protein QG37_00023 [Candidozyma auris]|uniref:Uncharacterized protein n=1 Tax=Candidozyma auris TaxID=498019 RepID=A0A0L0P9F3_CANAR|nr:hypothetical protein QG37_00023 [[Candida] auris]